MKLFYRERGEGIPLIIIHGLWGASDNWLPVANILAEKFRVILPDLRNHGRSPHSDEMNYHAMSDDIIELIKDLNLSTKPYIAGHSVGGKVVITLLMKYPELIEKAIVIDIAPIAYTSRDGGNHSKIIDFMHSFDLKSYTTREQLTLAIRQQFRSKRGQQLLLKNISKTKEGFKWRVNYKAISANFANTSGIPEGLPYNSYDRDILFLKGEYSNLIPNLVTLQKQFPAARLQTISSCGHWLHSEQPAKVASAIRNFIFPK